MMRTLAMFIGALGMAAFGLVFGAWLALGTDGVAELLSRGPSLPEHAHPEIVPVPLPDVVRPPVVRTVYLNREGATLRAGRDDSRRNLSSIVKSAGVSEATIPGFQGSGRRWTEIVACIREHFAPYDVDVVERRPMAGRYVMAVLGGRPRDLGGDPLAGAAASEAHDHGPGTDPDHDHRPVGAANVTGLAPFNGKPIPDAVVLIFARSLQERARDVCETAAMEIAHAYGLDHAYLCSDLMSYLKPCGRRRFQDEPAPCGEHEPRRCKGGAETQSSHQRLLDVLGPADEGP